MHKFVWLWCISFTRVRIILEGFVFALYFEVRRFRVCVVIFEGGDSRLMTLVSDIENIINRVKLKISIEKCHQSHHQSGHRKFFRRIKFLVHKIAYTKHPSSIYQIWVYGRVYGICVFFYRGIQKMCFYELVFRRKKVLFICSEAIN